MPDWLIVLLLAIIGAIVVASYIFDTGGKK